MSMMNTRPATRGKRVWAVGLAATLAAIVWSSAFAADARVLDRQRYDDTIVGHERTCGRHLRVETTFSGVRMTKSSPGDRPPSSYDNYNIHEVLTDAGGEGYIIDQTGLYNEVQVRHVRGTLYRYTAINVGQVFTIRTLEGKAVQRNHGLFEITFVMDTLGDADPGNDVFLEDSLRLVREAGKHPLVTETDAEFCAVIEEAIQG
jgi:hypothetical protein